MDPKQAEKADSTVSAKRSVHGFFFVDMVAMECGTDKDVNDSVLLGVDGYAKS